MNARRQCSVVVMLCLCPLLAHAANSAPAGDAVINPVALQPLDELSVTHDRPLFSPIRRPPPKPPAVVVSVPEAPPPPPPSVVLLGVVSEDGNGRAAIRSHDKVARVQIGDDVGGWKVERIEPRRLVLTLGERSVDFSLFSAAAKGSKPADPVVAERRARQVH